LNGSWKTGREAMSTVPKFTAAAATCRTGSARYSSSRSLLVCSHSISLLKSWSGASHHAGIDVDEVLRAAAAASGRREMNASSVSVPYWPNSNHVKARTPIQPPAAVAMIMAGRSANHGVNVTTISR
jgi:hypothetical protein